VEISFIQPSRNNLKYLKWSYDSIRKNQGNHDVEICVADDNSNDGTWEWCLDKMKTDSNFKAIRNDSGERKGHTLLYDELLNDVSTKENAIIYHADMYLAPGALDAIEKHLKKGVIVSLTRVEPPLHPPGPEKVLQGFGIETEEFDEKSFLKFHSELVKNNKDKVTEGIFAPWAFVKSDFQEIKGHDPLYRPQSKEDCVDGDTLLFIEKDGFKQQCKVQDLWDKYYEYSYVREDGVDVIDINNIPDNIKVFTPLSNGDIGLSKLRGFLRKKTKRNRLVKLKTNFGEVVVTEDHSLIDSECNAIKIDDITVDNIWKPIKFTDSIRRNLLKELDLNEYANYEYTNKKYTLPTFKDIDEYGNNSDLINACEFLGFFVAEGSTSHSNSVAIHQNDISVLDYFRTKSISFFGCDFFNNTISESTSYKLDGNISKPVYSYRKGSIFMSKFMINLVGGDSSNKKIPDFIFNLPKVYQEAFLYGYLVGDGYLGKSISRQSNMESFSVDKRLFFMKDWFKHFTWKSTSKSSKLTSGIMFIIKRCFPQSSITMSFQDNKGTSGVYNIHIGSYYKDFKIDTERFEGDDEVYVYDLEVNKSHTFIGGTGLIGLHNSDIFDRFHINGIKFIQTWEGYVYHMTCRGSRYNPNLTTVGKESDEWLKQNVKSTRNFIRKWGRFVSHDKYMKPIVYPRYKKLLNIDNINLIDKTKQKELINLLEPWFDNINVSSDIVDDYIKEENKNTDFDLSLKFNTINTSDINVTIDVTAFGQQEFDYITMLPAIIQDSGEIGSFQLSNLHITINNMTDYNKDLIVAKK
jgi:intein/homing endonuclease